MPFFLCLMCWELLILKLFNFITCFICICWDNRMVFILSPYQIAYVEPSLHPGINPSWSCCVAGRARLLGTSDEIVVLLVNVQVYVTSLRLLIVLKAEPGLTDCSWVLREWSCVWVCSQRHSQRVSHLALYSQKALLDCLRVSSSPTGSQNSHKGTLFMDKCQIIAAEWGYEWGAFSSSVLLLSLSQPWFSRVSASACGQHLDEDSSEAAPNRWLLLRIHELCEQGALDLITSCLSWV